VSTAWRIFGDVVLWVGFWILTVMAAAGVVHIVMKLSEYYKGKGK
jgi:hypothetical protein